MRKLLQRLLRQPLTRLVNKISSSPNKKAVFASLDQLLREMKEADSASGPTIPFQLSTAKFIILSDQHKGARDAADDFMGAEKNYLAALQHYHTNGFFFVNIGDCEELWESKPEAVLAKNQAALQQEAGFFQQKRYCRIFGNHDLAWKYQLQTNHYLQPIFGNDLKVPEGILLTTSYNGKEYTIFLTHGHQGDRRSDGNAFSKWVVANIWTPIERYLGIRVNTLSDSFELVDKHNITMYQWSATQNNLIFISGHTHKPVFASLDHIEMLTKKLAQAKAANDLAAIPALEAELAKRKAEYAGKQFHKTMVKPTYFNTGCCCFEDGDITGIEIEGDGISLVKWKTINDQPQRMVLEQSQLSYIFEKIS